MPTAGPPESPLPSPNFPATEPPAFEVPSAAATFGWNAAVGKPASNPSPRPGPTGPPVALAMPTCAGPGAGESAEAA